MEKVDSREEGEHVTEFESLADLAGIFEIMCVLVFKNLDSKSHGSILLTYVGEGGDFWISKYFSREFLQN
jgi:hypothetical protein